MFSQDFVINFINDHFLLETCLQFRIISEIYFTIIYKLRICYLQHCSSERNKHVFVYWRKVYEFSKLIIDRYLIRLNYKIQLFMLTSINYCICMRNSRKYKIKVLNNQK